MGPENGENGNANLDERQARLLFDTMLQGVVFQNADGEIISMNLAAEQILGKPIGDFIGQSSVKVERDSIREDGTPYPGLEHPAMVSLRTGREIKDAVMGIFNPRERRYRWISITAVPLFRPDEDRPYQVYTLFRDITEEKRIGEALRKSEARYRELFNSMTEGIAVVEPTLMSGRIAFICRDVNPAWERMFGRAKPDVVGRSLHDVFGHEVSAEVVKALMEVGETGRPEILEEHLAGPDRYYNIHIWSIGERSMVVGLTDITDIKRAQVEAERQRERLQLILDNTPVAIGITDKEGRTILDNGMLEKIWRGRPAQEGTADRSQCRAWWAGTRRPVGPDEWPAVRALRGEASTATFDIERLDGTQGALVVSATPILDRDGSVAGTVWTNQDVSELRSTVEALRRSNAQLQQYAHIASHDLQEPLRMVSSYLQLLERREREKLDPISKRYIDYAVEGAGRMRAMINDILIYSSVEGGEEELRPVNMEEVLPVVLWDLAPAISESGASITHDLLPTVQADRAQMVLLLENLIGNAIKYRGLAAPQVHISSRREGGEMILSVADNGIGIDPRYANKLFRMFSRLHAREEYPGTGMGLAICKRIVERHGGRIWFESELDEGTTFYFSLPIAASTSGNGGGYAP